MSQVVTRFAPSPTGYLHVGGARTALFSWLYAKKNHGKFILRVEDTDLERSTPAAVAAILEGMAWLDLQVDEGPYYQTKRFDRYKEVVRELLDQGKAYKCYCSRERLEQLREAQMANKQKPRYDRHCLGYKPQDGHADYVVRFKNPSEGYVSWDDAVKGEISIANTELDDLIIQRSDGSPTYNFCVVVDDIDMGITHVVRGDDHVNNTPRQINLYHALGAKVPVFAHVPMILGEDGKKLSKRHGAVSVMQYREDGYLPQALLNYLVRLGWSHGDQEIFSLEEMLSYFELDDINPSASAFNTDKLNWLNQYYLRTMPYEQLKGEIEWHYQTAGIDLSNGPHIQEMLPTFAEKVKTLVELVSQTRYFYQEFDSYDATAIKKHFKADTFAILQYAYDQFALLGEFEWFEAERLHQVLVKTAEHFEVGMGKVGMPVRVAVTGSSQSPDIGLTLKWIGHERVLARLQRAIVENQ